MQKSYFLVGTIQHLSVFLQELPCHLDLVPLFAFVVSDYYFVLMHLHLR